MATNNDGSYNPNVKVPMIVVDDDNDNDNDSFSPLDAIPDFMHIAEVIMNRRPRRDDEIWTSTKFRLFREFFGTTIHVVETVWELVVRDQLRLKGGRPEHLLWTLDFLKVYPKQGLGCSTISAPNGAVDPKTHRKWVWAFIEAISELVDIVVSIFLFLCLFFCQMSGHRVLVVGVVCVIGR